MISPKTIDSNLIKAMFFSTKKTSNVVKIQSWRREAEKLKLVNPLKYKTVLATIDAYENKNDKAIALFKSTLLLTNDQSYHAMTYANIANVIGHTGDYLKAIDYMWQAFDLTKDAYYFSEFLTLCSLYYKDDARRYEMSALDTEKRIHFQSVIESIEKDIKDITTNTNFDLDLYREILKISYISFFKYCTNGMQKIMEINQSEIHTILFSTDLDLETVGLLNDEVNEKLIGLLDSYEYEEILKYPILFTAENFAN